jgi:hypothetical protein
MTKYRGIRVHHKMTLAERLAFYSEYDPETGCTLWKGANRGGRFPYGVLWYKGVKKSAHIWAWENANGRPVQEGMEVCHHCDRPPCIDRDHLFEGTPGDNSRDCVAKGRHNKRHGSAHHKAKLTEAQILVIREDGRLHRLIAADYGVSRAMISYIKRGEFWRHVQGTAPGNP